ncbi:MAG: hypothetical protein KDD35_06425, partial [Bdellovibrionales bacterium]|nr:hypothetical protein [Bdellovibrionales bacterium]
QVSSDGLVHTFKIRKGVKFHDNEAFPGGKGREVTAQDFVYSWRRLMDPSNSSDGSWIFEGRIVGLDEWREKMKKKEADYDTPIEGIQTPDSHTLVIKLKKPYYQLHYVLALVYTSAVPREAVEKYGKEYLNHPVGTGPFKFDSWIRNSRIVLAKNPEWLGHTYPTEGEATDEANGLLKDAGKKIPFADKIVFHEIIEDQPAWLKFQQGELDMLGIPKDNFDSAVVSNQLSEDLKKKGIRLDVVVEPDVTYTAFNMLDPLVGKNENLRKAISLAEDTQTSIAKFYNGRAVSAQSPIPPGVDAYDPEFKNPYKEYNLEKAKEYLAKAGYPEGKGLPELVYSTTNSSTAAQMAEFFKINMSKIGIKVKVEATSWPQFTEKVRDKKGQIWGIAWLADYPDAENFLQLLYGKNISPGPNGSNFVDAEFDSLYEKAALLPPGTERTKLYREMRDIVVKKAPWVPGVHRLGYQLYQGWIENFKYHSVISGKFKYYKVNLETQKALKAKF